jgi:predicted dehydrogenase
VQVRRQLRVGIVGCGDAGEQNAAAIVALPGMFRLAHVHDEDAGRAAALAASASAQQLPLNELLAAVDVVCIASPDPLHARHVVAACRAGVRGMVVETPAGLASAEVRAMAAMAARCGSTVLVAVPDVAASSPLRSVAEIRTLWSDRASWLSTGQRSPAAGATIRDAFARHAALLSAVGDDEPESSLGDLQQWLLGVGVQDLALVRSLVGAHRIAAVEAPDGPGYRLLLEHDAGTIWLTAGRTDAGKDTRVALDDEGDQHLLPGCGPQRGDGLIAIWRRLAGLLDVRADDPLLLHHVADDLAIAEDVMRLVSAGAQEAAGERRVVGVGAGVMGTVHLGLASTHGRVVRVASRNSTSAAPLAMLFGASAAGAEEPTAFDGADVATIASPPRSHAQQAMRALTAGCAVLVEKPMAATVGEARQLAAAVEASGLPFVYAENWAYQPTIRAAVTAARDLALREVTISARWPLPDWLDLLSPAYGGAAVFDGGPHVIELARLLLGRPVARSVTATFEDAGSEVDLVADLRVSFAEDCSAHITIDLTATDAEVVAVGADYELRLAPEVELRVAGRRVPLATGASPSSWTALGYVEQTRALFGEAPIRATVHDGLATVEITAAAYQSAALGKPIALPFEGPLDLTPWELWRGVAQPE